MPAKFPWPRAVALLVLLLLPCLQYPGAMPGPKVVAADEHLSVHHAFRSAEGPGGWVRNHQLSDPAVQFRPLRDRIRRSWSSGRPPLWNPDLHAGVPLLADGLSAGMYPPVSLELVLPPATAQDLRLYLALVGAGLGAALLAWLLGASAAGGLVAGAVAMLSAFPVCRLLHPHAWVYAWTPWLAWALLLLGRRRGGSWLVAVFWAAMLLAGHPQTAVHGLLFALAVAACLLRGWRAWAQLLLGLAVGSLLAAPALLPFAEHLSSSVTLGVRGSQSLPWSSLLTLAWPDPFGHPARGDWAGSGAHLEQNLHVGLVALLLAFWGLRRAAGRWWLAGAALALALALGLPLLDWIPANHARLGGFAGLAIAVAAGLALPRGRWAWLLVVAVCVELLVARRSDQGMLQPDDFRPTPAAWAFQLAELAGAGRVSGLGWALQPDTGMLAGLRDLRGYELPVSADTELLMAALDPALVRPWFPVSALSESNLGVLAFGAVRYLAVVAGDEQAEASVASLTELSGLDAPLRIFELDPHAPRAWLAYGLRLEADARRALASLDDAPAARRRPPVQPPEGRDPVLEQLASTRSPVEPVPVELREPWPERVELRAAPEEPALLVLADAWAPGWRVQVDGEPRELLRVGGAFRGVALGAGEHEVLMDYRPWGWTWGLRLGLLGLLGLAASAVIAIRRSSKSVES